MRGSDSSRGIGHAVTSVEIAMNESGVKADCALCLNVARCVSEGIAGIGVASDRATLQCHGANSLDRPDCVSKSVAIVQVAIQRVITNANSAACAGCCDAAGGIGAAVAIVVITIDRA